MVLEDITTSIGNSLSNDISYWLLVLIISFFVFLGMKMFDIPKTYAGITSLLLTVFLLEFVLKVIFGTLNIPLNFGSYVVTIPFYKEIILTEAVMGMRFLDMIFNFGAFRFLGLPYYEAFITASGFVPTAIPVNNVFDLILSAISSPFNFFVFLYTSIDSIIEYIFFYFLFLAAIILITDLVGTNTERWRPLAFLLAAIPVLAYSTLVSNPIQEYSVAIPEMQKVAYFLSNADSFSIIVFTGTLLVSFLLVMEILAATFSFFYGMGEATLKPEWASKHFEVSTQGMGFIYTLAFAIMYAMHQYAWYIFFPAMVLYSIFKTFSSGAMGVVREHNDKQELADYIGGLVTKSNPDAPVQKGEDENSNILFWLVFFVLLGVIVYGMIQLKLLPALL